MDIKQKFCNGDKVSREEKLNLFLWYMNKARSGTQEMSKDKRNAINLWGNVATWGVRFVKHIGLGVGYGYILSWWFPAYSTILFSSSAGFSLVFFGYFDYWRDKIMLYKLSDKYTQDTFNFVCKKDKHR